jgi:hypothetical protein
MLLITALFLYLLVVIATFLIAYRSGIRKWSALVLGLIVGWIILIVCCSPQKTLAEFDGSSQPILYMIIAIFTPLIVIIYCVICILMDTCECDHTDEEHMEKYTNIKIM